MTFFLKNTGQSTGLPPMTHRPTGAAERMAAAGLRAQIEADSFQHEERMRDALIDEMATVTGIAPEFTDDPKQSLRNSYMEARSNAGRTTPRSRAQRATPRSRGADIARLTAALSEAQASGQSVPDELAALTSPEAFEAELLRRRRTEYADAQAILDAAPEDAFASETIGSIGGAMADEATILTLPLGGPGLAAGRALGWSALRTAGITALAEGGIAATDEALRLGRTREVAEDLELGPVNPLARVGGAFAAGAVLGGGFVGGARYLEYRMARRLGSPETAPAGVDPIRHENDIRAAEQSLIRGDAEDAEVLPQARGTRTVAPLVAPGPEQVGADPALTNPIVRQALDFIGDIEAPRGYNQVHSAIEGPDRPPRPLSEMTVDEVLAWQDVIDPKYQSEAAGRYQIMEDTLRHLKGSQRLSGDELFNGAMQDRLAVALMREQGLDDFLAGRMSPQAFGNRVAGVWAGLPQLTGAGRGSSVYAGLAGNRALRSARQFERVLSRPGSYKARGELHDTEGFTGYASTRGYTNSGQVAYGNDRRIDVDYEVVDLSTIRQASGDLQPRDRTRGASDAWVAQTASGLDPALLMPAPTADRGTPIIGPDGIIESGNGRARAIERVYDQGTDRADAYRRAIEGAGYAIPEGVERPVLVARRTSELSPDERRAFVIEAQDSGVARMTAEERARVGIGALDGAAIDAYRPDAALRSAENRDFARSFVGAFPASERGAFTRADGTLSDDAVRQIRDTFFARAYDAPDLLTRRVEEDAGPLKTLLDALSDASPELAALRIDIARGLVAPEMDITAHVVDAVRLIADARDLAAARPGTKVAALLDEMLADTDLLEGAVAPLTRALVGVFAPGGRQAGAAKIAEFLRRYAREAREAGRTGSMLDPVGPLDVLRRMAPDAVEGITETGIARSAARAPDPVVQPLPDGAFDEGARSVDAIEGDRLAAEGLQTPTDTDSATRAAIRDARGEFGDDIAFEAEDGSTWSAADMLADLDQDDVLKTIIDGCSISGRAA